MLVLVLTMQGKNEHPVRSALVSQGDSCLVEHDTFHAIGYYQKYLETHPRDLSVVRKLASCHRLRGDNKKCISCMESIPSDSINHEDMRMLYYVYLNLGNNMKVDQWGLHISMAYPYDSEILSSLCTHWNNLGKPEKTEIIAKPYIAHRDSTNLLINKEYAYSLFLQFKYDKAIPLYKGLIADGFDNYESNFVLGLCYYNTQQYTQAKPYLDKAVTLKGDNADMNSLFYLGMTCKKLAETTKTPVEKYELEKEASQFLERSITVAYPRSRGLYVNQQLAEIYYGRKQFEKAGHAFAMCIEYDDEDSPLNYYNAAQMYITAQKKPQARLYLQMFLAKADKIKDEKEKARLTSKAKEQIKTL